MLVHVIDHVTIVCLSQILNFFYPIYIKTSSLDKEHVLVAQYGKILKNGKHSRISHSVVQGRRCVSSVLRYLPRALASSFEETQYTMSLYSIRVPSKPIDRKDQSLAHANQVSTSR